MQQGETGKGQNSLDTTGYFNVHSRNLCNSNQKVYNKYSYAGRCLHDQVKSCSFHITAHLNTTDTKLLDFNILCWNLFVMSDAMWESRNALHCLLLLSESAEILNTVFRIITWNTKIKAALLPALFYISYFQTRHFCWNTNNFTNSNFMIVCQWCQWAEAKTNSDACQDFMLFYGKGLKTVEKDICLHYGKLLRCLDQSCMRSFTESLVENDIL